VLKADTLYPVTICETIEEVIALRTENPYSFALSTNPHAAHVISPMENPAHFQDLGFLEYKHGKMLV
jgi:hypothetical protein